MKVIAKRLGYYDHVRRKEGDVFHVAEDHFSSKWMEKLDSEPVRKKAVRKKKVEPVEPVDALVEKDEDDSVI